MDTLLGVLVVGLGGLIMGSGSWPFKLMKLYKFEHWWFVGMLVGLVIMPWAITLLGCPGAMEGLRNVPADAIIKANIFAFGWGIANVLCGLCFVRIGMALTGAILAGLGVSFGVTVPMIFKGSGQFEDAADIGSAAGLAVLAGVAIMLVGVVLAAVAGFGRDKELKKTDRPSGGFLGGLIMTIIAGVLSAGTAFTFVYSQGPIVSNLSIVRPGATIEVKVEGPDKDLSGKYAVGPDGVLALSGFPAVSVGGLRASEAGPRIAEALWGKLPKGVELRAAPNPPAGAPPAGSPPAGAPAAGRSVEVKTGSIAANFGVWAVGLMAGAAINIGYAAYLLTKRKSWGVLLGSAKELILAIIIGVNFSLAVALMGKGMLLLGALGGSVGFGIQQAMQMTGSQAVGFISGEWRGVLGKPRNLMYIAIAILITAAGIMAFGNSLAKS